MWEILLSLFRPSPFLETRIFAKVPTWTFFVSSLLGPPRNTPFCSYLHSVIPPPPPPPPTYIPSPLEYMQFLSHRMTLGRSCLNNNVIGSGPYLKEPSHQSGTRNCNCQMRCDLIRAWTARLQKNAHLLLFINWHWKVLYKLGCQFF
jgi:hypothetical protein